MNREPLLSHLHMGCGESLRPALRPAPEDRAEPAGNWPAPVQNPQRKDQGPGLGAKSAR